MSDVRARPEDAVLGADPVVGDAGVVGAATGGGPAELGEDLLRVGAERHRRADPLGQPGDHLEVGAHAGRRLDRALAQDHPALEVGHGAGLLGPLGHRQHHVGQRGGLAHHEVGDDQQVERRQPVGDVVRVGSGHHDVAAEDQQRPRAVRGAERVEQLVRRAPRSGQRLRVHAPHAGDVGARRRVVDHPVAGQLVGLLPVLAAALTVALAGETAVAGERRAGQPQRERDVDPGQHRGGALGVLLGTARGEHHGPVRAGEQLGQRAQLGDRDAGDPFHPLGPPGRHRTAYVVPAGGAGGDVLLVDRAGRVEQVQHAERERQVGAGHRLEEQVGAVGGRRPPRVDHDHPAAALTQPVEVTGGRRHRFGEVGADKHHHVGLLDVGERERQPAVDPEGTVAGRGGRRHAPAAVVVDLAGAEGDPGELAELVGLLVGEPAASEHRDAVRSALPAQLEQPGRDQVERLVPRSRAQLARGAVAEQRAGQPLAVAAQLGGRPPLAAQRALVDRELRPRTHRKRLS